MRQRWGISGFFIGLVGLSFSYIAEHTYKNDNGVDVVFAPVIASVTSFFLVGEDEAGYVSTGTPITEEFSAFILAVVAALFASLAFFCALVSARQGEMDKATTGAVFMSAAPFMAVYPFFGIGWLIATAVVIQVQRKRVNSRC